MKNLFITFFLLSVSLSCNSSKTDKSCSEYKVLRLEGTELDDFVEVILVDDNEQKYFVISSKMDELNKNNSYDTLKIGQNICINLIPQDTTYRVNPVSFRYSTGPYEIYFDKMLLIRNGIVIVKVYRSDDLINKFIKKSRTRQH